MRTSKDLIDWDEFQFQAALVCYYLKTSQPWLPVGMKTSPTDRTFSYDAFCKLTDKDKHYFFVCAMAGAQRGAGLVQALHDATSENGGQKKLEDAISTIIRIVKNNIDLENKRALAPSIQHIIDQLNATEDISNPEVLKT